MVRIGTLPTRLLALDYGGDILYCEVGVTFSIYMYYSCDSHVIPMCYPCTTHGADWYVNLQDYWHWIMELILYIVR